MKFNTNLEASSNFARSKAFLSGLARVDTLTARQGGRLASFSFSFSAARSFMRFQLVFALQIVLINYFNNFINPNKYQLCYLHIQLT